MKRISFLGRVWLATFMALCVGVVFGKPIQKPIKGTFQLYSSGRQTVLYANNATGEVVLICPGLKLVINHCRFELSENAAHITAKDFTLDLKAKHKAEGYAIWDFRAVRKQTMAVGEVTASL